MNAALAVLLVACVPASLLQAQGTKTHEDPAAYSAHTQVGEVNVAADLLGHNIPLEHTTLDAKGFLVVEVALFAPVNTKIAIEANQFTLKINGERLLPVSPGQVTLGYAFPEMRNRNPRVETEGGVGPVIVATGQETRQPRFPGDNSPANRPLPPAPRTADDSLQQDGPDPVEAVKNTALPEGRHATPVSGYLFYPYSGKLKRVKHAELEYTIPLGTATLTLR